MSSKNGLRSLVLAAAGFAALAFSGQAKAEEPAFLAISGGAYDVNDSFTAGEFRAEYRFAEKHKLWVFTPFIGVMGTTDSARIWVMRSSSAPAWNWPIGSTTARASALPCTISPMPAWATATPARNRWC